MTDVTGIKKKFVHKDDLMKIDEASQNLNPTDIWSIRIQNR